MTGKTIVDFLLAFRAAGGTIEITDANTIKARGETRKVYDLMAEIRKYPKDLELWKYAIHATNRHKSDLTLDLIYGNIDKKKIDDYKYMYCPRSFDDDSDLDSYRLADSKKLYGRGTVIENAKRLIEAILRRGPHHTSEILRNAEKLGYSERTMRKAASQLGVVRKRLEAQNTWIWSLPKL